MRDWGRVLFVGWGDDAGVSHYRTKLPAMGISKEWVTILMDGEPCVGEGHRTDHDLIVVQSCWEPWQLRQMQRMRASGARVIANVDDWLPAIAKLAKTGAHGFASQFVGKRERTFIDMVKLCDAAIVSTPWLAAKLESVLPGKPVCVARNGLDLWRYDAHRGRSVRPRELEDKVILGWAGGTGHGDALLEVLPQVWDAMRKDEQLHFLCIGDPTPLRLRPDDLDGRVSNLAWADMAFYPLNIDMCDIMLAPTRDDDFYRGKSQLRFYEAAAMGKPTIASEHYTEIEDGRTGFVVPAGGSWTGLILSLASSPRSMEIIGQNARRYVEDRVRMEVRVEEWKRAIMTIDARLGSPVSA